MRACPVSVGPARFSAQVDSTEAPIGNSQSAFGGTLQVVYTLDDKTVNGAADTGLNSPELAIGLLSFTIDGRFLASLSFGG